MSIRSTIATIGPVHIWRDTMDDTIYVETKSLGPFEVDREELEDLYNDLVTHFKMETHNE